MHLSSARFGCARRPNQRNTGANNANVVVIEVDYPSVVESKINIVAKHKALAELVADDWTRDVRVAATPTDGEQRTSIHSLARSRVGSPDVPSLHAPYYHLIGADLSAPVDELADKLTRCGIDTTCGRALVSSSAARSRSAFRKRQCRYVDLVGMRADLHRRRAWRRVAALVRADAAPLGGADVRANQSRRSVWPRHGPEHQRNSVLKGVRCSLH